MPASNAPHDFTSPISRLPIELLTRTFLICNSYDDNTLISASQVSRYWRAVALGYPDLWTDIDVEYPLWAEEMLRRSKNALIHIHSALDDPTPDQVVVTKKAIHEIHRVEGLSLLTSRATAETLFDILPNVAPHLEHLELVCIALGDVDYSYLIPVDGVNRGATPGATQMRHLELEAFQMKWGSPFLRSLTHFSLERMTFDISLTLIQFIDVLRGMPMLEHLYISAGLITSDSDANLSEAPPDLVAELPFLMFLQLRDAFELMTCAQVVDRLLFPSDCTIRIELPEHPPVDDNDLEVHLKTLLASRATSKLITHEGDADILFPTAHIYTEDYFCVQLSRTHLPASLSEIESSPYFEVNYILPIGTKENTIRILADVLPFKYLTSFFVDISVDNLEIGQIFWTALLPNLHNLKEIEIVGDTALSFLDVLSRLDSEHAQKGNGSHQQADLGICLPLLERVRFLPVNLGNTTISDELYKFFSQEFADRANFQGVSVLEVSDSKSHRVQSVARVVHLGNQSDNDSDSDYYSESDSDDDN